MPVRIPSAPAVVEKTEETVTEKKVKSIEEVTVVEETIVRQVTNEMKSNYRLW